VVLVGMEKKWFHRYTTYRIEFNDSYNITPGTRVKLFGTDVGTVREVFLTRKNKVRLKIKVLSKYASRIREDSLAVIESPTVIGSEFVNISPGDPALPMILPERFIASKDRKQIAEYLEEFKITKKIEDISEILSGTADIVAKLKKEDGPLFRIIGNIEKATGDIAEGKGTAGKLIAESDLHDQLRKDLDEIGSLVKSLNNGANHLVAASENILSSSKHVKETTEIAPDHTRELLGSLVRSSKNLELALKDLPAISTQVRHELQETGRILESIKKNFIIGWNLPPEEKIVTNSVEVR
jgi:phospholipid/cholesterol/gamma-HCH transport system substrate-binding protein